METLRALKFLFARGRGPNGQLLQAKTLESMWKPQYTKPDEKTGFGLAFFVSELDGKRKISHGGAVYGFATEFAALPDEKLGVIVMASRDVANGVNILAVDDAGACVRAADIRIEGNLFLDVDGTLFQLLEGAERVVIRRNTAFHAGRIAMAEGMPKCSPVLLEPVMEVEIAVPTEATARVNAMISQRRGQILGFDARDGWPGWDVVKAQLPESEIQDLIVELRSATAGVGTYTARFHHLAELTGRLADTVLATHKAAAE